MLQIVRDLIFSYKYAILMQIKPEEADEKSAMMLNSVANNLKISPIGLIFPKLDLDSTGIRGNSYAPFAHNKDSSSELSMLIELIDRFSNASIIHYATWKSRSIVRSIRAAEVYALSVCHGFCQMLAHDLKLMIGRSYPLYLMVDSKSVLIS